MKKLRKASSSEPENGVQKRKFCIRLNEDRPHFQVHEEIVETAVNLFDRKIYDKNGKLEKFESFDCIAALTWLYAWKHQKCLDAIDVKLEQRPNHKITDTDYLQRSGWDYLNDCLCNQFSPTTIQKANKIMVLNEIIAMISAKTGDGRVNMLRFYPEKLQKFLDKNELTYSTNRVTYSTNGVTRYSTNGVTNSINGVTNSTNGDRSIVLKDNLKNDFKDSVSDTLEKNHFLRDSNQNDSTPPKPQKETKAVVNQVNYNSVKEFTDELTDHLMDNRKSIKETVLEFDFAKIPNYSEKYASIVFSGKYEGLKSLKSYDSHFEKLRGMGVLVEVNAPTAQSQPRTVRGEGQLSIDMKNGTLAASARKTQANYKTSHSDIVLGDDF